MTQDELTEWETKLRQHEAELFARENLVINKERDLAIYESRVERLYKEAFPELEMKLRV